MSARFQDKYRISSTRLQNWDYTWNAIYFVTINTHGQEEFFGEIKKGKMILSSLGTIADVFWHEIRNHFSVVDLDAFVVMPNHIHGILAINNPANKQKETGHALSVQQGKDKVGGTDSAPNVKTRHALSPQSLGQQNGKTPGQNRFQNQGKNSLSSIVGSYKSAVSKHAHRLGYRFDWQERFHDRIIRNEEALLKARKYIENNVANWKDDPFNSKWS